MGRQPDELGRTIVGMHAERHSKRHEHKRRSITAKRALRSPARGSFPEILPPEFDLAAYKRPHLICHLAHSLLALRPWCEHHDFGQAKSAQQMVAIGEDRDTPIARGCALIERFGVEVVNRELGVGDCHR